MDTDREFNWTYTGSGNWRGKGGGPAFNDFLFRINDNELIFQESEAFGLVISMVFVRAEDEEGVADHLKNRR